MGAKTGLLAWTEGDVPTALRQPVQSDREAMAAVVRQVLPGYAFEDVPDCVLGDAVYPTDEVIYATSVGGTTVLCDQRFMIEPPSTLPRHLIELAGGRRIILHAMHSVSDWFAFAIWEQGLLVRSLSLSPATGILENIGEPLAFELPYWAGDHPAVPIPGWPSEGPYPFAFHPLDLGEAALRALFGFIIEGRLEENDVDPYVVNTHGFRAIDPSGAEQAQREAIRQAASRMRLRRFTYVDGQLVEVQLP